MARATSWPSAEDALDIHTRLCADDPVASSDLAIAYIDPLADWLLRSNPGLDPHFCEQAAADAILSLALNPATYQPDRGPLDAYLRMSARADLRNLLKKEGRHLVRREDIEAIELPGSERNIYQEEADPSRIVEREELDREFLASIAPEIASTFTREEICALELLLQGERETPAFARVLGITGLTEIEQRREVKRVKDRIKRRLQRWRSRP